MLAIIIVFQLFQLDLIRYKIANSLCVKCKFCVYFYNLQICTAGECTSTKRNQLTNEYLETEVATY